MEITLTEKGKNKIDYLHVFRKMLANDVQCFNCELRRKGNQCKTMIKLDINDEIIGEVNRHANTLVQMQVEVSKV